MRSSLAPAAVARTIFASLIGLDELSAREAAGTDLVERTDAYLQMLRFALSPDPA